MTDLHLGTQSGVELHRAHADDIGALAHSLARAFADDPICGPWLFPSARSRPLRMVRFFRGVLADGLRTDLVLRPADCSGAAVWVAPERAAHGLIGELRTALASATSIGLDARSIRRGVCWLVTAAAHRPREPHWYLYFLGVDPAQQGTGRGHALLQAVLDHCDATGTPAYLETAKPENVEFYGRHGFEIRAAKRLWGGPMQWYLWRDPVPVER